MSGIVDFAPGGGPLGLLPQRYDVTIYQGDTFEVILTFKDASNAPIDLTDVTYACNFVLAVGGEAPASPTASTLGAPANGQVQVLLADTHLLTSDSLYNWDLQLIYGGKKRTYIGGQVTITSDLTP